MAIHVKISSNMRGYARARCVAENCLSGTFSVVILRFRSLGFFEHYVKHKYTYEPVKVWDHVQGSDIIGMRQKEEGM